MKHIPNAVPVGTSWEFVHAVLSLDIKTSGDAQLPKDKFLRHLTRTPPWELLMLLSTFLGQNPEFLMLCGVVPETLARSRNLEFRTAEGYFTLQEIDWDADEVRAHITFCFFESSPDPTGEEQTPEGRATGTKLRILFLAVEPLEAPSHQGRTLRGQATVSIRPKGKLIFQTTSVVLAEGQ
jgi:hypothetical protein